MRTRELDLLIKAVTNKQQITIELIEDSWPRKIEPYAIFRSSSGKILLECYQLDGFSESDKRIGWRTINVAKIKLVRSKPIQGFEPRSEFKPDSPRYADRLA